MDWYQVFFGEDYLRLWRPYLTPERDAAEVEELDALLALAPGKDVLDLPCGHGRMTIPLSRRGYRMTGMDLSRHLLDRAAAAAGDAEIRWVQGDMRRVPFEGAFDAVLDLFSSFGYFDESADDLEVLRQIRKALRPGGLLILELLNRETIIRGGPQRSIDRHPDGLIALHEGRFDLVSSRNTVRVTLLEAGGARKEYTYSVRLYTLTELIALCRSAGLQVERVFGGLDQSPLTLASPRVTLLCRRPVV